jgi:hypothetical protein
MKYFLLVILSLMALMPAVEVRAAVVSSMGETTAQLLTTLRSQLVLLQTQVLALATSEQTLASTTVAVNPKWPVCNSFKASPATITKGGSSKLTWDTTNAKSVTIKRYEGNVTSHPVDGSASVNPAGTFTFVLTAKNDAGSVTCNAKVTVKEPLPVCDSFTVSPASVSSGASTNLSWKTTNATAVTIDNGVGKVQVDGTTAVKPTKNTTYTLTASNSDGVKTSCTSAVTVKPVAPNLSFCADTLKTKSGTLCAIQPSKIDSRTKDVSPSTGIPGDSVYGFGYHVFAVPNNWSQAKGVWVHFTGSYGRPYYQNAERFETDVWLEELMEQGYAVLQLAYDNRFSINGDLCGKNNEGYNRNNCAGEVREIGLTSKGSSPYRSTDQYNTIDYRLKTLVGYIEDTQKIQLPDTISASTIDWSKLDISGHSQGGNQAYYIAKQRSVNSLCFLSSGYDSKDTVKPGMLNIADWFTSGASVTPVSKMGALIVNDEEEYYSFYNGLTKAVGLKESQIVAAESSVPTAEKHGASVKDPALKASRAKACF